MDEDQKPQERKKGKGCCLILFLLGACSFDDLTPDQFITSYGMGMQDTGSFSAWDPVHLDTGDFEMLTFGLAWDIGPRQVEVVEFTEPIPYLDSPLAVQDVGVQQQVAEALQVFTAMDLATRIMLVILVLWITFIYRRQLARLIPWGSKGA
jgi:hypothetical protein